MNKKIINISLPQIEGIELKKRNSGFKKRVLWLRNMGEEDRIKAKKETF